MDRIEVDKKIKGFIGDFSSINGTITKWREPLIGYAHAKD